MPPSNRPSTPHFSSGPTAKLPGWSLDMLKHALLGRSHRSSEGRAKLQAVIEHSREILQIPADYRIAIMPGSDTGAFEAAMWSLLGPRGVDVLVHDAFGQGWLADIRDHLKLADVRAHEAPWGRLPDLGAVDPERDIVFCWNGTTSGVRIPDGDWIAPDRAGLTFCDATSAVFAMPLPWDRLDVVTWSWQKVLGGEAQHGMLALSPRAAARLESYTPPWPLPKIFRLTAKGKLNEAIFKGDTINTPSMLAVEDALVGLEWAAGMGGVSGIAARAELNLDTVEEWVARTPWVDFLAHDPAFRSPTSVCLEIIDPAFRQHAPATQEACIAILVRLLAEAEVAFDIKSYRGAPLGLRLWCGATIDHADIVALLPWLDWAFAEAMRTVSEAEEP
ncbi:phosphoserine aminotransferase apoenzyme [Arboricoccus pini]|uniref:phosphoserine transaminase n=1 Tax=Arboricoccus pini TaxID=1963835 RepID=A0A212QY83_9PROT|nr:phosphoserine transaminase [Arboricoccus pini]SNB64704.1 phosphoserine aminotransferase apoenzyme [Arboricoccus pini]